MENTSQPMDVNVVDLGDNISSVSPTLGIGSNETVGWSTPLHTISLANVNPESGAYEKKQRAKTYKVWNDFEYIVVGVSNLNVIGVKGYLLVGIWVNV
jgi:hypothetical protein